jgi:hypothetical protein
VTSAGCFSGAVPRLVATVVSVIGLVLVAGCGVGGPGARAEYAPDEFFPAESDRALARAVAADDAAEVRRTNAGGFLLTLLRRGADPRATNSGGATFQDYYFGYDEQVLNDRARAERREIAAWLVANGVPLHPDAPR